MAVPYAVVQHYLLDVEALSEVDLPPLRAVLAPFVGMRYGAVAPFRVGVSVHSPRRHAAVAHRTLHGGLALGHVAPAGEHLELGDRENRRIAFKAHAHIPSARRRGADGKAYAKHDESRSELVHTFLC